VGANNDTGTQRFAYFGGKFNSNEREMTIFCPDIDCPDFAGELTFQSASAGFLGLAEGSIQSVRLHIKYNVTRKEGYTIGYGQDFNGLGHCSPDLGDPSWAEKATVQCTGYDNGCYAWTISGDRSCLMDQRWGNVIVQDLSAPFALQVCLKAAESCP
jgi:hypothetical protein